MNNNNNLNKKLNENNIIDQLDKFKIINEIEEKVLKKKNELIEKFKIIIKYYNLFINIYIKKFKTNYNILYLLKINADSDIKKIVNPNNFIDKIFNKLILNKEEIENFKIKSEKYLNNIKNIFETTYNEKKIDDIQNILKINNDIFDKLKYEANNNKDKLINIKIITKLKNILKNLNEIITINKKIDDIINNLENLKNIIDKSYKFIKKMEKITI